MKKGLLKLSAFVATLFVGVISANAAIDVVGSECRFNDITTTNATCDLKLQVSGDDTITTGKEIKIIVKEPSHIVNNAITIQAATGWTVDGEPATDIVVNAGETETVTFKYTGTETLSNTTITIAAGNYVKDDASATDCGFNYGIQAPACSPQPDSAGIVHYYGQQGQYLGTGDEGKDAYYADCFACATPDTPNGDGKYHDKNGKETDEAGYNKDCTNICKKEDGKYYCKTGAECTEEEYKNECEPAPKEGSFLPYAGIIAGVVLIATSTIMVRKQSKLRKL